MQHNVGKSEYQLTHAAVAVMQFGAFYCWAHMLVAMGDSFRRRVWGEKCSMNVNSLGRRWLGARLPTSGGHGVLQPKHA